MIPSYNPYSTKINKIYQKPYYSQVSKELDNNNDRSQKIIQNKAKIIQYQNHNVINNKKSHLNMIPNYNKDPHQKFNHPYPNSQQQNNANPFFQIKQEQISVPQNPNIYINRINLPKEYFINNIDQNYQNQNNHINLKKQKSHEFIQKYQENCYNHVNPYSNVIINQENIYKENNNLNNMNYQNKKQKSHSSHYMNDFIKIQPQFIQIQKKGLRKSFNVNQNKPLMISGCKNDYNFQVINQNFIQRNQIISNGIPTNFRQYRNNYNKNMKNAFIQNTATQSAVTQNKSDKYVIDTVAGSGTFGVVYIAKQRATGQKVAHKKVLQDKRYKNRELEILQKLNHPNIVRMRDSFITNEMNQQYLNIIMDYYPQTLGEITKKKVLSQQLIKLITYQIFKALQYLAFLNIAHRDIKPHNILIDRISNHVAICDFGSAKKLNKGQKNLAYICSRCFRSSQLIFGATDYTTQVDVWAAGCILFQMINGKLPFVASSQNLLLTEIIKLLGTPSEQDAMQMNPQYDKIFFNRLPKKNPQSWSNILKTKDPQLIDLVSKILVYSPKKRLTPTQVLNHSYFDSIRNLSDSKKINRSLSLQEDRKQIKSQQNVHLNYFPKKEGKRNLHGCMSESPNKKNFYQYLSNQNLKLNNQNLINVIKNNNKSYNAYQKSNNGPRLSCNIYKNSETYNIKYQKQITEKQKNLHYLPTRYVTQY